jgi:hypothetical protein
MLAIKELAELRYPIGRFQGLVVWKQTKNVKASRYLFAFFLLSPQLDNAKLRFFFHICKFFYIKIMKIYLEFSKKGVIFVSLKINNMTYAEEKVYLHDKCAEFIHNGNPNTNAVYPTAKNRKLKLWFNGEDVDTEVLYMYTEGDDDGYIVWLKTASEAYEEDINGEKVDFCPFDEFSNEEMKKIMKKFGISTK